MKAANKHTLILTAATKVFAKKGFFNARISDIAKEAKVADGTIYLYFNNKHDILISVFEEEIGSIFSKVQQIVETETDPKIMLTLFIVNHLKAMKRKKYFAEVIQIELRQADKVIKEYRNTRFSEYLNFIAKIVRVGQDQGVFRSDLNPDILKRFIFGALDETSRVWNISLETNYSVEETSNQLVELIFTGLQS